MAEEFLAPDGRPAVQPASRDDWRAWLAANHETSAGAWAVTLKKGASGPRVEYAEIVEEALCFGWIDSKGSKLDDERSLLWCCPRKPQSAWSGLNKERIARLTSDGRMTPAGIRMVELAKARGTWSALDEAEKGIVPPDLEAAFAGVPRSRENWDRFSPSSRRAILQWISQAKRPETRAARVAETAQQAQLGEKANQWPRKA